MFPPEGLVSFLKFDSFFLQYNVVFIGMGIMKKIVWFLGVMVVVAGVLMLLGRNGAGKESACTDPEASSTDEKNSPVMVERGTNSQGSVMGSSVAIELPEKPSLELSGPVKALLGQDGKKHNYPSLLTAINALDQEISATDVAALREMLNFSNDQFPEKMRPIEINAVKNDVLDKLLRQKDLPEGLGLQMVEMAGNAENDPVWRDYCIQFMTPFYDRVAGEGGAAKESGEELSAVHDAMFAALNERDATLAGTSLIGLELLSRTHKEFDRKLIVAKATEIASDEMASSASRLTALRLSASGNLKLETGNLNAEVVDAARSLAQTGETVLLRSAAIVTLGEIGTFDDRELLESYVLSENKQIAAAAKMALEKMDQDPLVETDVASRTTPEPQVAEKLPPVLIN